MKPEFPKNGLFITDELQAKIDALEVFAHSFIDTHASVFKDDEAGEYIRFRFDFPRTTNGQYEIRWDVDFDEKLPKEVKAAFKSQLENFLKEINEC